jgi:ATP-binding cassette subfamily B protein
VIAGLGAMQPLLTRLLIDQGLLGRNFPSVAWACAGMLGLAVVGTLLGGIHRAIYVSASGRVLFSLRTAIFGHLMRVSPRRLGAIPVGDLVSRLDGDVAEVQRFGTDSAALLVSSVLSLLVVGAVMVRLSWQLSLVVLVLLPLQWLVRHYARPRVERTTRDVREAAGGISSFLVEILGGARAVQAAAAERIEEARLGRLGSEYLQRVVRSQLVGYATGSAATLLGHVATAGVFLYGGHLALRGEMTVGTLVAFAAYLGRSAGSASSLVGLYTGYQRARVSLARVGELLVLPEVPRAAEGLLIDAAAEGRIELQQVTVRAPRGDGCLLEAVDVTIAAGTKVVLGGASGAGKSTFGDVLRRFVDPDAGRVLLDGRPLPEYDLASLRSRIAIVEHSPVLFHGTLLDNIRYGHPDAAEEAVTVATRRAGIDDYIRALPEGYATRVGEGGAGLSTGQRQRIAIARAVLADPLVVILDEATSGLDVATARGIHEALDSAFSRRTRIVITHRAADIERADLRLDLADGQLRVVGA